MYNNICLENVLVAKVRDSDPRVTLINLELCTDYLTKSGEHIKPNKVKTFIGNVEMASSYAMNLNLTSRRDDIISLAHLLIFMVQGHLSFLNKHSIDSHESKFNFIKMRKNKIHSN